MCCGERTIFTSCKELRESICLAGDKQIIAYGSGDVDINKSCPIFARTAYDIAGDHKLSDMYAFKTHSLGGSQYFSTELVG